VDQEEGEESSDRGQISQQVDREHASSSSADGTSNGGGVNGGLVGWVEPGGDLGEETIDGHGEEDTGLSDQEDQHDRDETGQDTDLAEDGEPLLTSFSCSQLEAWASDIRVVDNAQHDNTCGNIQDRAGDQGQTNTDGQITLGVASFLSSRADSIKTDEGEEHNSGTTQNTRASKRSKLSTVGWNEGLEVVGVDPLGGTEDEDKNDNKLDNDQDVVDTG
jgi:hypothetical protein